MSMFRNSIFYLIIFLCIIFAPYSDVITGSSIKTITLDQTLEDAISTELKSDNLLVIMLGEDIELLVSIQIELIISDAIKKYSDGFVLKVFSDISPEPDENNYYYNGIVVFADILPHTNRTFLKIPINSIEEEEEILPEYMGVTKSLVIQQFPIIITIQPAVKGIPDTVLSRNISLNIKPEVAQIGYLDLNLVMPQDYENEEVNIFLNNEIVPLESFPLSVKSGMHNIRIESAVFDEENINIYIGAGSTETLDITLKASISTLIIDIDPPADFSLFLDENKLEIFKGKKIELTVGEHTIRFKLGSYSISKKFIVNKGKDYNLSIVLDIDIKED